MAGLEPLSFEPSFQKMLMAELSDQAQALFNHISELDLGPDLLRLFAAHPRTHLTADDIAYQLGESPEWVEHDLCALVKMGVVQLTLAAEIVLYGLTTDPRQQRIIRELYAWQGHWELRLDQIKHVVLGHGGGGPARND
jgi:hypothetical protein